jgi:Domain of unknown function (DUF4412)
MILHNRRTSWIALLALVASAAVPLAAQDLIITESVKTTSTMMGGANRNGTSMTYFSSKAIKVSGADKRDSIIRFDEQKIVTVDHDKKTYSEMTFKELEERISRVGEEMEKNKEQLEAMKKMMGQVSDSFTVEKIGPGDAIAGYDTEKYLVKGPFEMEVWAAPALKTPTQYYDLMKLRMPRNPLFDAGKMYDEMKKIDGMTLKSVMTVRMMGRETKTVTEAVSVEKTTLPPATFAVPSGYTLEQRKEMK